MENGIIVPKGINLLRKLIPSILEDSENGLTSDFRETLRDCYDELVGSFEKVGKYDKRLQVLHNKNEDCKRLSKIEGVGLVTSTSSYER